MHARVSTYQGPSGLDDDEVDDVTRELEHQIMPKVRAMDGFAGLISLMDRTTGKSLSITLWKTADAMAASETDANAVRDEAEAIASEKTLSVERFEVTLHETV